VQSSNRDLHYSQNRLHSNALVDRLLDVSSVRSGDLVMDLGAGTGIISHRLASRGCRVIAVETDTHLVTTLRRKFASNPQVRVCDGHSAHEAAARTIQSLCKHPLRHHHGDYSPPHPSTAAARRCVPGCPARSVPALRRRTHNHARLRAPMSLVRDIARSPIPTDRLRANSSRGCRHASDAQARTSARGSGARPALPRLCNSYVHRAQHHRSTGPLTAGG
jgi:hypothetical protein